MPEAASIRPYSHDDKKPVLELLRSGLADLALFASQVDPPENENYVERELKLHKLSIANDPENWVVAILDNAVVGTLRMRFLEDQHGPYASVRLLAVAHDNNRKGIEQALIEAAIERAKNSIATRLFINDIKTNPILLLFRKMGFRDLEMVHRLDRNPNHRLLWLPTRVGQASGPPWGPGPDSRGWWIDESKEFPVS